jgi:nicotinate-nucleotide pyrophosphorylase (carboxylating)
MTDPAAAPADRSACQGTGVHLSPDIQQRLHAIGLDPSYVEDVARRAVDEDLDGGVDVTSVATVAETATATADFVARADGVVAGIPVAAAVLHLLCGDTTTLTYVAADGDPVARDDILLTVTAPTRGLLTAERTALNLMCRLAGIATATRRWVDAVEGTGAAIRDTRKTTPGLRPLEKYAVRCGGGVNHRMSLSDAAMVKDNHVVAAGGVVAAFELVRAAFPGVPVEVEADSVEDAVAAVDAGAELVLLDNMAPAEMTRAVQLVGGRARLEASGGLTLATAREVADTGVDYISVGALTHSAPILDIALDFRKAS